MQPISPRANALDVLDRGGKFEHTQSSVAWQKSKKMVAGAVASPLLHPKRWPGFWVLRRQTDFLYECTITFVGMQEVEDGLVLQKHEVL